jgi:hypothetical protein
MKQFHVYKTHACFSVTVFLLNIVVYLLNPSILIIVSFNFLLLYSFFSSFSTHGVDQKKYGRVGFPFGTYRHVNWLDGGNTEAN